MTELASREGSPGTAVELAGGQTLVVSAELLEKYPALNPDLDLEELLEDALGPGGELRLSDLTRIKVPAAELDRLMVPDENGRSAPVDSLRGIPVAQTSRRSWWADRNPSGKPPDCSSRDLENGVGVYGVGSELNPSGKCADCPMSAPGSAPTDPGKTPTMASACKEQRLLFLLTDRELLPLMIVVPPGSLPNHKQFGVTLAKQAVLGPVRPELGLSPKGRPMRASAWLAVEIELALDQKTNPAGNAYNMITFNRVRKLTGEEMEVISSYGRYIDGLIVKQAEALDAVGAEAVGGNGGAPVDVEYDDDGMPTDEVDVEGLTGKAAGKGR